MEPLLHSPAAHSLVECLRELKFGRPANQQLVLDEAINFVRGRLGDDGPGFSPEIVGAVFNESANAEDKMIIHDGCGLPVELCECKDAPVRYNSVTDTFDEKPPAERNSEEERFTSANKPSTQLICPWAEGGECGNVNIKCSECLRSPTLKDWAN
jgi:hypothetical protein